MLTCQEVVERASDYVDGRLTRRQAFGFRLHLSLCKNCRLFVRQFRTTIGYVRLLPDSQPLTATQVSAIMDQVMQKSNLQEKEE